MTTPWPFSTRGARQSAKADFKPPRSLNFESFDTDDEVIKIWLSDTVTGAIDMISIENDNSRQDVVRSILFEYLYGAASLMCLLNWQRAREDGPYAGVVEALRSEHIETIGKSSDGFKLHLPEIMKTDMEKQCKSENLTLSDFCRRVLERHLFGIRMLDHAVTAR